MSIIDTLIYDRTQADIDRVRELKTKILKDGLSSLTAAEKSEYMAGMKGAYNYSDMNRVGQAVAYIANRMTTLPVELATYRAAKGVEYDAVFDVPYDPAGVVVSAKTNWAMGDTPTQALASTYINNLAVLRRQITLPAYAPEVPPSLNDLKFSIANNIEYLLYVIDVTLSEVEADLYAKIDHAVFAFAYANLYYCGE